MERVKLGGKQRLEEKERESKTPKRRPKEGRR